MKKFFSEIFFSFRKKESAAAFTSLSLQVGSLGLTFAVNLFLARMMLPPDYGAFAYASTLIFVLAGLGTFGTLNLIVKETGAARDVPYNKKLILWSANRSGIFLLLVLAVFIFVSLKFHLFFGARQLDAFRTPMLISLLSIPLLAFLYICQAFLQGRGKIFSALFSEKILKSVFFLLVCAGFYFASGKQPLNFSIVAVVNVASFFIAVVL
jgi:O-antigen/teichoic acid export membrane protein